MVRSALLIFSIFSALPAFSFSVGTQNLYHYQTRINERVEHLKQEIAAGIPDIMGFQEAARWKTGNNLYDHFINITGYQGIYENTNNFILGNEGIALVSRFATEKIESFELPATKMFSRQSMNIGIFNTEIGRVIVVNAHLSPFKENRPRRIEQVKFMLEQIKKYPALPVIIAGDLNDIYPSSVLKLLLDEGFVDVLDGKFPTYDPSNPLVKDKSEEPWQIDFILYKPTQLKLQSASSMFYNNWVSDHYGVKAEFSLP